MKTGDLKDQVWVEVDLNAIEDNLKKIKEEMPNQLIMAVVKANAYGHGMVEVARFLEKRVRYLGVGNQQEAIELRQHGIEAPIMILCPYFDPETVLEYGITPTIDDFQDLINLERMAEERGTKHPFHLKINTGMNRFGIQIDQIEEFAEIYSKCKYLQLEGVYSHFATTKKTNYKMVQSQLQVFEQALGKFRHLDVTIPIVHMANSEIAIDVPSARYDMVRIGNALYGQSLSSKNLGLKTTLKIKAHVIDLVKVEKGQYVGYGAAFKAKKEMVLAVIPFGIYEGFGFERERRASGIKELIINLLRMLYRSMKPLPNIYYGKTPLQLVGKPSMHFIMADVSKHREIEIGSEVEIKAASILAVKETMRRKYKMKQEEHQDELSRRGKQGEI